MKFIYKTERSKIPIQEYRQAIFQDFEWFREHNIKYVKKATHYIIPCDEQGNLVQIRDAAGGVIDEVVSAGAYQCAADKYDKPQELKPQVVKSKKLPSLKPYAPF